MSFCRWSSMDHKCDLYCYESSRGFETIVARLRIVGDIPAVDTKGLLSGEISTEEYMRQSKLRSDFLETAETKEIGLKYDGRAFLDDKETLLSTLKMLKEEGYIFPEITQEDIGG